MSWIQSFSDLLCHFSQLIPPFKAFSNALYAAQKGIASLDRIQELVTAPVTVEDPIVAEIPVFNNNIVLKNVGFGYLDGAKVIDGFDLEIKKGRPLPWWVLLAREKLHLQTCWLGSMM